MSLPVPSGNIGQGKGVTRLGTAEWYSFPEGQKPSFKSGDLWLSRMHTGESVGYADDRHALVVSGTRSGKGTSIIVPNLILWPGSAVVIDPKGENATVTARRRGKGSTVMASSTCKRSSSSEKLRSSSASNKSSPESIARLCTTLSRTSK
ncbi:type IV secretory system conjugative DNA transfer family protein [Pelagibacterium lacus]|uniref:Type IV secretory system conjugative DNA transfer family protein n=1 Tax=Pelagibacterium lacus TaxID=2282655 RepID=A0A369W1B7_9HYPH|nr:type IV secretory system conjugative DNA transfer family protein [Pelagibacterium lacus]RDE07829.1 hypothetical protein DVH29_14570 [Pelagibacterium lacus]